MSTTSNTVTTTNADADEREDLVRIVRAVGHWDKDARQRVHDWGAVEAWERLLEANDLFQSQHDRLRTPIRLTAGAELLLPGDSGWPSWLTQPDLSPLCLWAKGDVSALETDAAVYVTGARASSSYGTDVAQQLGRDLSAAGVTVVSGSSYGIEADAIRGALAAEGTPPVIMLPAGIELCYPHTDLVAEVERQGGAILAAMPPASQVVRIGLQQRARILAQAHGTVIVEAGLASSARIVAAEASRAHRAVLAVPGPVTSPVSAGCNALLRDAAAEVCTSAGDAIEALFRYGQEYQA